MIRPTYHSPGFKRAASARQQTPAFKRGVLAALVISGLLIGFCMASFVYADDLLDRIDQVTLADPDDQPWSMSLKLSDIVAYEDRADQPDTAGILEELRRGQTIVQDTDVRSEKEVRNILLIASDEWDETEVNRPDAIVLLTIAHGADQVRLTPFLDTMAVDIPQKGWSMLSHAYSWGGPQLLCETFEHNFRIDLQDFLVIDTVAFESAVDRVDGIDIVLTDPEVTFVRKNFPYRSIKRGEILMDGELAVAFSRTRLSDAEKDRLDRQQRVVQALIIRAQELSRKRLNSLILSTFPKTHTNLSKSELFDLMMDGYKARQYEVRHLAIPTDGTFDSIVYNQVRMTKVDLPETVEALHTFVFE